MAVWAVLLLAFAVRIQWFGINRTLWPDEAVYLLMAGSFAGEPGYHPEAARPALLPLLWSLLLRLGCGTPAILATQTLFSLLGIYCLFRLGEDLHDRRGGTLASLLLAVFPLELFLAQRMLTDVPALALWLLVLHLLWRHALKDGGDRPALLLGPAVAVLLLVRPAALLLVPLLALFWLVEKGVAWPGPRLWASAALGGLVLLPYLAWSAHAFGHPLAVLLQRDAGLNPWVTARVAEVYPRGVVAYLRWLPSSLGGPALALAVAVGVAVAVGRPLAHGEGAARRRALLLLAWFGAPLLMLGGFFHAERRYLLPAFPALFLLAAAGWLMLHRWARRGLGPAATGVAWGLLACAGFLLLSDADRVIRANADAYRLERRAAEWIHQHGEPDSRVVATEAELIQLYSRHPTDWYPLHLTELEERLSAGGIYLVHTPGGPYEPPYLRELVERRRLAPAVVLEDGGRSVRIYRVP